MKTIDYINKYKEELLRIEFMYNKNNDTKINNETIHIFGLTEGMGMIQFPECEIEELNKVLLQTEPLKVFLFEEYEYNKIINHFEDYEKFPENKKIMVVLFSSEIEKMNVLF
ncbi:MAG: hypothetical protein SPE59_01355 [Treponema sp.]|nr:hypothetical protein [Spirochaetia bacterium]MDY5122434.1 hypothetical protein [Treponema sp.]